MLYGDAQWIYAKTANECEKLVELNNIMENEGINTAVVAGEDSKGLGRKLRVYSRKVNYLVVNDGAESSFRTTFGGTTRYLDNAMQQGKTAIIATTAAYKTLPPYLVTEMKHFIDYKNLQIYIAENSRFDYVSGPVAEKNRVIDFPYSPNYIYENAELNEEGFLVMRKNGGTLKTSYNSVSGIWNYTVFYDLSDANNDAYMEIQIGEKELQRIKLDSTSSFTTLNDVVMTNGENVRFIINAPENTKIKKIEIIRKQ